MARLMMVYLLVALAAADDSRDPSCTNSCHGSGRQVCGTDGITYPSKCHLRCADVALQHRGKCRPRTQQCFADLATAKKQRIGDTSFIPTCRADGSYAPVQCHRDTGFCWCVDPQGRAVPRSQVRKTGAGKPRCNLNAKSTTKRRSSSRNKKPKRGCKRPDKAIFNNNLIDIFQTEWSRIHSDQGLKGTNLDHAVLDWKFRDMDHDRNGVLDKTEYRDLRKLVKRVVKPKRCSKSFARACDVDRDQQISRQEWGDCLTRDGMDDDKTGRPGGEDSTDDEEDDDYGEDLDIAEGMDFAQRQPPHGVLQSSPVIGSSTQNYGDDSSERRDEDATDCLSDRQSVLNEQRSENMYVPECTPDGRYQKIQCYKSVGYCWCVHEDTGSNIPGTSVKNSTPKCDQIPAPSRPMKGCPEAKKTAFLKDLIEFLHNRMVTGTNDTNITGSDSGTWQASREEKAATWNFVVLDKNKNKVLERKEWKAFRTLVSATKQLRRCGKKLPRYCDVNHDRKISMTEWLDCLNTKRNNGQENTSLKPASHSRRRGPNPIESYLKWDD